METIARKQKITSATVLSKIIELADKQQFKRSSNISIDTLALIFNVRPQEILPYIVELEWDQKLKRNLPPTQLKPTSNLGSVTLL